MESLTIDYKIKSADDNDIFDHLIKCKNNFIPSLDKTVDIPEYSKKIADNAVTFEAWVQNDLIGLIAAYFNDKNKHVGFITNVSVVKELAGKGIASKLLQNCIQFATKEEFGEIVLEVNEDNGQAIQLYHKHKFTDTGKKGSLKIMTLNL